MITAIWCENSALVVGMPRRSTEWSTESSCTSVARWISSTTAASVTPRGSSAPAAWWLSSSSVGRNSLPFIRSKCSLTSAMTGKSAAMMRRSSSATRSSSLATGRWRSASATGATCWLTSLHLGERPGPRADILEADIHGENPAVLLPRLRFFSLLLERPAEPVQDAEPLLITRRGQLEPAPQDRLGHDIRALVDEADAQRLGRPELALGRAQRLLELGDRLVEQPHLLERDPQVVVRLEVRFVDVLVDPLLESGEHLLEVLLLVPGRLLVRDLHTAVAHQRLLVEDHRAEVDEIACLRHLIAHLHLRVLGRGPPLPRGRLRRGRRRSGRREHGERRLRPFARGVVLGDPLVNSTCLVRQVLPQQRVRQLEIRLDELRLVTRLERVFHLLLPVTHTVRVQPEDLLHQVPRLRQIPQVLETRRRVVELLDPAVPFARLDQRLAERLVRLRVVRVVGDALLELLDGGRRRRGLDVREHQRGRRVSLVDHAVQAQVDERRLPRLRDRRVIFGLDESPRRRDVLDRERLVVHIVARLGDRRIKVGLELERRHFDHGFPLR